MRLRSGASEGQLRAHLEYWQRELGKRFPGSTMDLLMKVDNATDEYLALHLFADAAAYHAMDGDGEQDRWYRELVTLLVEEPQFTDVALRWSALGETSAGV
jgi:hypothetical protein